MCFAPEADVFTGIAITAFAIDAAKHYPTARYLGLAAIPGIFATHTFSSAFVWWGLRGEIPQSLFEFAKWFYLFIAFTLWPIFVPISIALIEKTLWRRQLLWLLAAVGVYAGTDFLNSLLRGNATAVSCDLYIDYIVTSISPLTGAMYVIATCGTLLLSSEMRLFQWGAVNAVVVLILALLSSRGFPSLWCFAAASTSFFIAWHLREVEKQTRPVDEVNRSLSG